MTDCLKCKELREALEFAVKRMREEGWTGLAVTRAEEALKK